MVKALLREADRSGHVDVADGDVVEIYVNGVASGNKITVSALPEDSTTSQQVDFSISLRRHVNTSAFNATELKAAIENALAYEYEGAED